MWLSELVSSPEFWEYSALLRNWVLSQPVDLRMPIGQSNPTLFNVVAMWNRKRHHDHNARVHKGSCAQGTLEYSPQNLALSSTHKALGPVVMANPARLYRISRDKHTKAKVQREREREEEQALKEVNAGRPVTNQEAWGRVKRKHGL